MSEKEVKLSENHVRNLRAILNVVGGVLEEIEEELPEEDEKVELNLENKHIAVLASSLEGYQDIYERELPDDRPKSLTHADFDVIREVLDKIRSDE